MFSLNNYIFYCIVCVTTVNFVSAADTKIDYLRPNCSAIKAGYVEKRECFKHFVNATLNNVTEGGACTNFEEVQNKYLSVDINKKFFCKLDPNNTIGNVEKTEILKNSIKPILDLLKYAFDDHKMNKFKDEGGLKCINTTRKEITDTCINTITAHNTTNRTKSIFSIYILHFQKAACNRADDIMKCVKNIMNKTCTAGNVEFVMSLHTFLKKSHCNFTSEVNQKPYRTTPVSSSAYPHQQGVQWTERDCDYSHFRH
ncbi:hypothetical protein evm_002894 [Chilo suppressalis]|nr:hypothetical protein evm_002894 [Chilo suppressalis]